MVDLNRSGCGYNEKESLYFIYFVLYQMSQKNGGAFVGLWHRIVPLDHGQLNFSR